jgi:MraZ protein
MVLGQYVAKVDEKFRVSLPRRFREFLGEKLVVTKGLETNLIIVSASSWESLLEGTASVPFINKDARELQRFLLGNAAYLELDEKGRMLLPSTLRLYAKLGSSVLFAGMNHFVELWDERLWDEEQVRLGGSIATIAQRLAEEEKKRG